jgi:hypothetical protein
MRLTLTITKLQSMLNRHCHADGQQHGSLALLNM